MGSLVCARCCECRPWAEELSQRVPCPVLLKLKWDSAPDACCSSAQQPAPLRQCGAQLSSLSGLRASAGQ